ncbi:hydrogenase expression/formation protein HypD [Litorivivens lipolytica]|uniref:Hydrogenase maturation factor n=1 Tax=Litorivivens lipolytica TaxID=1524264 RepID=A0A7W4W3P1_9GAMM|nr:hydrogenase formation protein HypD [Litorivivens lipolytica]MBB3046867.1 hydrogenase expression/formation protein HypD [Litorivivens lipolytica]
MSTISNTEEGLRYLDEFRDPALARQLLETLHDQCDRLSQQRQKPLQIMEVCGGHTHSIFRYGLHDLLPDSIELVHGPGCPVCVLPKGVIDDCLRIATAPDTILASFGDALRVPGAKKSLLQARAEGADVRVVYSPLDALNLARQHPDKTVVFFALGFETTLPATALALQQARASSVDNFLVYSNHITILATIRAILQSPDMRLDGFLGPGHACMIIGTEVFRFVPERFGIPFVVAGFEPLDILQSITMIVNQHLNRAPALENQYTRVVRDHGNAVALQAITEVFEVRESFEWRGLGAIDQSGLRLRAAYRAFDAEHCFDLGQQKIPDPSHCQCGEVLKGVLKPSQCKLYSNQCTPEQPQGALMVSSEGACAAYYNYGVPRDQCA